MFLSIINNKNGCVIPLYRSQSETTNKFDSFFTDSEKLPVDISSRNQQLTLIIAYCNEMHELVF